MNAEIIKQKLAEFDKRWEIVSDSDYRKEFDNFRVRILNLLNGLKNNFKVEYLEKFCQIWALEFNIRYTFDSLYKNTIIAIFNNEKRDKHFYKLIQSLFYLPDKGWGNPYSLDMKYIEYIYKNIQDIILYSYVNLNLARNNYEVVLYPKGEKVFDEKLVNQVLSFLNPGSNTLFVEGLKSYLEGTDRSFIVTVEKMRRTLEEFLRYKLNNKKGLNENIKETNRFHKSDDKDKQIRNIITAVFSYLDEYFNDNSKHKDGDIDNNECEYIIYQTGVLLRYINTLVSC
ncbi:MAG: hypothetical protein AB2L26_10400 [Ignavibacteria bacterium]